MSEWRYIATRLHGDGTETVLDYNVPVSKVQVGMALSGPDSFRGTVSPEMKRLKGPDGAAIFEPWSTVIYAEANGVIRGGAILDNPEEQGPNYKLDCVGFSGYANGMPYTSEWTKYKVDPLDAVRHIWAHLQGHRDGDLGLEVDDTTSPVRVGTKTSTPSDRPGGKPSVKDEPFKLAWFQTGNLGQIIDELARETPFDYRVRHYWDGDVIRHRLELGYPTLGRRRHDLRFVVGENIFELPKVEHDGAEYASEVIVLGAGEGRKMVRGDAKRETGRLRRAVVVEDKRLSNRVHATSLAWDELRHRLGVEDVTDLEVEDHPHAPLGSVEPGDEILLETSDGWHGHLDLWVRVLNISITPATGVSRFTVTRVEKVTRE